LNSLLLPSTNFSDEQDIDREHSESGARMAVSMTTTAMVVTTK